jgi:hypothetical protein
MTKLLPAGGGASKRAARIVVLTFVVFAAGLSPTSVSAKQSPTPTAAPTATATATATATPTVTPTPSASPATCVYPITTGLVINSTGKNYAVGDKLRAIGGTSCIENFPFTLQVTAIDVNGGVTAVAIISADSNGYLSAGSAPSNPIGFGGSATGAGFKVSGISFATATPTP